MKRMYPILLSLSILFLTVFCVPAYSQYDKMLIGNNNSGNILIANADGSSLDSINLGKAQHSYYSADIDPVHKKIYMSWYWGIYSMNYDGSKYDTLVNYPSGGYSMGITVDVVHQFIYWASTENKIYKANLDGSKIDTLFTLPGGLNSMTDIVINVADSQLYFGAEFFAGNKGLYRIKTDGTKFIQLRNGIDVSRIAIDQKNKKVYYTASYSASDSTRRMNYDGSNDTVIMKGGNAGMFVDTIASRLIITDDNTNSIIATDLNGKSLGTILSSKVLNAPQKAMLFSTSTAGINNIEVNSKVRIYPNPTTGFFVIETILTEKQLLQLFNITGKLMLSQILQNGRSTVDVSNLAQGVYNVCITSNEQKTNTRLVIVK